MKQEHLFHPYPITVTPLDSDGNPAGETKTIWAKEIIDFPSLTLTNGEDIIWQPGELKTHTILTFHLSYKRKGIEDMIRILCGQKPLNRRIWKLIGQRRLARQRRNR